MDYGPTHAPAVDGPLASVSNEVFTLVLAHLGLPDILNVGRTCKRWQQASCDSAVWRRLFLRHFTVDLHHHPPPLLVANAFASAHGAPTCPADPTTSPTASGPTAVEWKSLFRLQYCWANGRCSRRMIATGSDANGDLSTPLESGAARKQNSRYQVSAVSFLAVSGMALLGKRNGDIVISHTHPTSPAPLPQLTRLDPPAPILGLFHLAGGARVGQSSIVVALTPRRVHCFTLDSTSGSLTLVSSAKHSLLSVSQLGPLKLLSLPFVRGSFVDQSTLVLLVAPVLSTPELKAPTSTDAPSAPSPSRAPTLSIMDPTTGALSHIMTGIPPTSTLGAFDLLATLNSGRSCLTVLISMSTQLYTAPESLEHHELRLQTFHFQRAPPNSSTRDWYHVDSQVVLPTWTPNSLWPSPLSQQGIPLSSPTHHSPITSIRIAQDLIMSAPTNPPYSSSPSLAFRYLVAAHRDHSLSLYALVPTSARTSARMYFLGMLPDQVHSAILDLTITASIGRVVVLCRDGNARVWQLEPWLPIAGTLRGSAVSETVSADESGHAVDYDVLFHRPSMSYTRKSRYSMLHLSNATPAQTSIPRAAADGEDVPEGHYHQGVPGKWLAVDEAASEEGARGSRRSAWEHKRVRTDALVAEIPVLQGEMVGEEVERAWVHVARDQMVCALQNQVVCLNFNG